MYTVVFCLAHYKALSYIYRVGRPAKGHVVLILLLIVWHTKLHSSLSSYLSFGHHLAKTEPIQATATCRYVVSMLAYLAIASNHKKIARLPVVCCTSTLYKGFGFSFVRKASKRLPIVL